MLGGHIISDGILLGAHLLFHFTSDSLANPVGLPNLSVLRGAFTAHSPTMSLAGSLQQPSSCFLCFCPCTLLPRVRSLLPLLKTLQSSYANSCPPTSLLSLGLCIAHAPSSVPAFWLHCCSPQTPSNSLLLTWRSSPHTSVGQLPGLLQMPPP